MKRGIAALVLTYEHNFCALLFCKLQHFRLQYRFFFLHVLTHCEVVFLRVRLLLGDISVGLLKAPFIFH